MTIHQQGCGRYTSGGMGSVSVISVISERLFFASTKAMRIVFSRVLLNRSTWALAAGHMGVILRCLMPSCLHHAVNSSDPKGTLSDVMTSEIPCVAKIWVRCVMAVAAELERVPWTSGYFDVSSTVTKRYSPDGNGPQ